MCQVSSLQGHGRLRAWPVALDLRGKLVEALAMRAELGCGACPCLFYSQQALRLHLRLRSKDLTQRAARHSLAPRAVLGAAVLGFAR